MHKFLKNLDAFHDFSDPLLLQLSAAMEEVTFPSGQWIFQEGETADALYIVRSGLVRVIVHTQHGGAVVIKRATAGSVIGERALLGDQLRMVSARADMPCVVLRLRRLSFDAISAIDPLLQTRVLWLAGGKPRKPGLAAYPPPSENRRPAVQWHRKFVGGKWDEIGRLQFDFLVEHGLKPSHCLLDIACGALRGGIFFIRYLDAGNYLGLEKDTRLLNLGIEQELGEETYNKKKPTFVVSSRFAFHEFPKQPKYSIAQSLFSHLTSEDIKLCLGNLRGFVAPGHLFFATFYNGSPCHNRRRSHSQLQFCHRKNEMDHFGIETGWRPVYLGDWKHPRGQVMMRYEAV